MVEIESAETLLQFGAYYYKNTCMLLHYYFLKIMQGMFKVTVEMSSVEKHFLLLNLR